MSTTRNTPNGNHPAPNRQTVNPTKGSVGTLELVAYFQVAEILH